MAVPGHDERDFEFATAFDLPIVPVVAARTRKGKVREDTELPFTGDGVAVNSGSLDGLATADAKAKSAAAELASKSEETEAFVAEVEAIGAAYEESQTETARLMQRLTERDGTEAKAIQDAANANNRARRLGDELAGAEAAARHEQGVARAAAQGQRLAEGWPSARASWRGTSCST